MEKVMNETSSDQTKKYKILEEVQFMFANEADRADVAASIAFPVILNDITSSTQDQEIIFIPVNNPDFH
jgi:hypothetical protein